MSSLCVAQQAMNKIDGEGFTPHNADRWCAYYGGGLTFSYSGEPKAGSLWKIYKFEDGSFMNIHKNGCSVFYTEDEARRWVHWPTNNQQKLY